MNSLIKSFGFAIQGIFHLFKKERNFKIQFVIFFLVVFFGFYFQISRVDWLMILFCSSLVLSLEAINTSIERVCDEIQPELNPEIKIIKDVAAGAVLLASIFTIIIGFIIFFPFL